MNPRGVHRPADRQECVDRLRLLRTRQIGPVSYSQLLSRFGSASAALEALPDLAGRARGKPPQIPDAAQIAREMDAVAALGADYLYHDDPDYPGWLAQCDSAPPILIRRGRLEILARPAIAMVGARNASAAACRFAREIAADLAKAGYTIVSGLARGIDTAAHQGVLRTMPEDVAATVGVIACGIDIAYPPENRALQDEMGERALVLAEQPPGTEPLARHFPYRNRIIAGLSQGTLVVEAAPRSGSLITARLAAEMGREVMAIPGSPLDSRSRGCNELIRNGATLVQSAADVIEQLTPFDGRIRASDTGKGVSEPAAALFPLAEERNGSDSGAAEPSDDERSAIVALVSRTAVSVDELVRQSGLPTGAVQMALLELEIAGRLDRHAGGRVSLA